MATHSYVRTKELALYAEHLRSPEAAARKRAFADHLHNNPVGQKAAELKFGAWRDYFRACEQDPSLFLHNPMLIDVFVLDVERSAEFIDLTLCPWLWPLLTEVRNIANRTRLLRMAIYLAQTKPLGPLS